MFAYVILYYCDASFLSLVTMKKQLQNCNKTGFTMDYGP
jgi:hypothetical protein